MKETIIKGDPVPLKDVLRNRIELRKELGIHYGHIPVLIPLDNESCLVVPLPHCNGTINLITAHLSEPERRNKYYHLLAKLEAL